MAAELTDEQIIKVAESMPQKPWGIGSRRQDVIAFARALLATQQATQGAEPDGWLYVMHMEGGQKNKAFSDERYDFPTHSPFGRRGRDYSEEYEVTEHPICVAASPTPPTGTSEQGAADHGR